LRCPVLHVGSPGFAVAAFAARFPCVTFPMHVSHGLTPTAKCWRGFAVLSEVKTLLGRGMLIE